MEIHLCINKKRQKRGVKKYLKTEWPRIFQNNKTQQTTDPRNSQQLQVGLNIYKYRHTPAYILFILLINGIRCCQLNPLITKLPSLSSRYCSSHWWWSSRSANSSGSFLHICLLKRYLRDTIPVFTCWRWILLWF